MCSPQPACCRGDFLVISILRVAYKVNVFLTSKEVSVKLQGIATYIVLLLILSITQDFNLVLCVFF